MNWRAIRAIITKDLRVVLRTPAVLLPTLIVPIIMQVLMPAGFGLAATYLPETATTELDDLKQMLQNMPSSIRQELDGLDDRQSFLVLMTVYLFAPMYLIVPLMVASVIAADSFAGEKERKTLEALLHSPTTSQELFAGKVLSSLIPAVIASLISFALYTLILNGVGWQVMGRIFFPNLMWLILVFWVAPGVSCVGLGLSVILSSRVKTFQEAYQLSGLVVLPIVFLMIGQISGIIYLSTGFALGFGLVVWIIATAILWFGARTFQRDNVLAQL
jgi:ABC-type Na+ efflux pump permease subunit